MPLLLVNENLSFNVYDIVNDDAEVYYYLLDGSLDALRKGHWKLRVAGDTTLLFDMQTDQKERFNRASGHPERVRTMRTQMEAFADSLGTPLAGQEA